MDEYDKMADDFYSQAPRYRTKKAFASYVRSSAADAMFWANAMYQLSGVSSNHIGMIEVAKKAHELRKAA